MKGGSKIGTEYLCDRDEVSTKKHTPDSINTKQLSSQRTASGRQGRWEVHRASLQHRDTRNELEAIWIRRVLSLNEHAPSYATAIQGKQTDSKNEKEGITGQVSHNNLLKQSLLADRDRAEVGEIPFLQRDCLARNCARR